MATNETRALAREIAGLRREVRSSTTQQLRTSSIDNGKLIVKDTNGNEVMHIGDQWDGSYGAVPLTGPTPPTPTAPDCTGIDKGIVVRWDGKYTDSIIPPVDFSRVEVHVSDQPNFDAIYSTTLRATIETPRGAEVVVGNLVPGPYFVRLVCRSTPGKAGPQSDIVGPVTATESPGQEALDMATEAVTKADTAITTAQDAAAAVDGKVTTYLQAAAPVDNAPDALSEGDLWFDTDDKNKLYRWSGTAWVVAADQTAADALTQAQEAKTQADTAYNKATNSESTATTAYNLANSKIVTYYQTTAPAVNVAHLGDLWFDTDDQMRLYRYDGTIWRDVRDGAVTVAKQNADTALSLAQGKGKVYQQTTAPDGLSVPPPVKGDLWFSTADFILRQYSGSVWSTIGMDASQNIRANTVTAGLLATQIVLASTIVAGPLNDSHAELSSEGISLYQKVPDQSVPVRTSRLGSTGGDDFLQVYSRASGKIVASIDQLGGVNAASARLGTQQGDVTINGQPFENYIEPLPTGCHEYGIRTTNGAQTYNNEQRWLEVQTVLMPARLYRVTLNPLYLVSTNTSTDAVLFLRQNTNGAFVLITSQQIQSTRIRLTVAGQAYTTPPLVALVNTSANTNPVEYRFLATYNSEGTGSVSVVASSAFPSIMMIEDLGPSKNQVGIDFGQAGPPPSSKQNYTTYWRANDSRSYQGSGAMRSDIGTEMVHGVDPSGFNGNGCALALFTGGAYHSTNPSEVGKGVLGALSGATITAVDFMLSPHHAYYNSGCTAYYLPSTYTILPGTLANPGSNYYGYASFAIGEAKYVPSNKIAYTSIILGQAPSSGLQYYGRFDGAGAKNAPVMRVSYTR